MILIGIAVRSFREKEIEKVFVRKEYLDFLERFGFVPVIVPFHSSSLFLMEKCDGFLLPGGEDIDAVYYGEENDAHNRLVEPEIDRLDRKILRYAFENGRPILGICRGIQVINVYCRGTLIQHVDPSEHPGGERRILRIYPSSPFYKIMGKEIEINSYHHQIIGRLGEDLIAHGESDGAIELITHRTFPLIGVQYHPEKRMDDPNTEILMKTYRSLFPKG